MIEKVFNILSGLGIPIKWNKLPDIKKSPTVLSYHFFNEGPMRHGDGLMAEQGGALQVDIYSKEDYSDLTKEAIRLLSQNGFLYFEGRDDMEEIDKNTALYHKILIFNYTESEVLNE